jgi:hypothetical protein
MTSSHRDTVVDTSASTSPSPVAAGLGYLALVPFVAGAAAAWLVGPIDRPAVVQTLSAYAAVVLSFIGAIHWGLAFRQVEPAQRLFVWGVVPSLVAWVAVLARPATGLSIDAAMLVACYLVDHAVYPLEGVAPWRPLRLRLTVGAVASCLIGLAALNR